MWVMALAGVPLVIIGVDVVSRRRITDALRAILFRPEDTQIFEPRDVIWAWVMLVSGLVLVGFGLKELMFPAAVVEADTRGVRVRLSGPFRSATAIPWQGILDLGSGSVADEGDRLPVVWLRLADPDLAPDEPWGARWLDDNTIAILASDWDRSAVRAADQMAQMAQLARVGAEEEAET